MSDQAFVTLSTNDNYCLGALVLGYSLRNIATSRKLVILITPSVSQDMRKCLSKVYDLVQEVDVMHSKEHKILEVMKRPELGVTLTKIHCWRLTQFKKCIFMDADTLPLKNIDELFEKEELSAVCDIGWPDCFNTGLFVFKPSETTFANLCNLATESGSFDGGDQGLLNTYFSDWAMSDISKHLSFIYNMSSVATYSYPAAYQRFGDTVKVVHFLGALKPWMYGYNAMTKQVVCPAPGSQTQQLEHVQKWWDVFIRQVQPSLTADCAAEYPNLDQDHNGDSLSQHEVHEDIDLSKDLEACIDKSNDDDNDDDTETVSTLQKRDKSSFFKKDEDGSQLEITKVDESSRRKAWEKGSMDYLGVDSFDNIKRKLDEAIGPTNDNNLDLHEREARSRSSQAQLFNSSLTASTITSNWPMSPAGLASQLAKLRLDSVEGSQYPGAVGSSVYLDDYSRKRAWEVGAMDYMGADSFENIQRKLDQAIGEPVYLASQNEPSEGDVSGDTQSVSTDADASQTVVTTE